LFQFLHALLLRWQGIQPPVWAIQLVRLKKG
jgi:hypothetical protein